MSEVRVPVKVLKPVANFNEGDVVLLPQEEVKVLWSYGLVEVIDEIDRVIGEIDRAISEERESMPLAELPKDLYERAAFWIWYAENYVRQKSNTADVEAISVKLTKLANLKKKLRDLRAIRFRKIAEAAKLRPHSEGIFARLTPEEAEVYEYLSDVAERWLE